MAATAVAGRDPHGRARGVRDGAGAVGGGAKTLPPAAVGGGGGGPHEVEGAGTDRQPGPVVRGVSQGELWKEKGQR